MARPGQALVEYVLIIALVAVIVAASLVLFHAGLGQRLDDLSEAVDIHQTTPGQPGQGSSPPPSPPPTTGDPPGPNPPGPNDPPGLGRPNPGQGQGRGGGGD